MVAKGEVELIATWNRSVRTAKEIVLFLACPLGKGVLASSGYLGMWYHIISNPRPPVQAGGEDREKLNLAERPKTAQGIYHLA